jgi:hypothetical protein
VMILTTAEPLPMMGKAQIDAHFGQRFIGQVNRSCPAPCGVTITSTD